MDPTKSFDHLDPKLKDTYARVMGTDMNNSNNAAQNPADQSAQGLSSTPTAFDPTQPAADPNQLSSSSPLSPGLNQPLADTGPNPGTGPTITTSDPNTMFSSPLNTPASTEPAADPNSPATSSFFSNSSPATMDPTQSANAPIEAPVTPYVPEGTMPAPAADGAYTQPLPSPSSVNQTSGHETSALLKVLYIIGAVIFFAVYTIFWIKVFNLPFLF